MGGRAEGVTSEFLLTTDLLEKPASYSVRVIAATRLDEARAGYERYLAGEKDGLHELRVALRRLRSWLRAYRLEVKDTLRKKTRRRLSSVAKATNGVRDAEVAALWFTSQSRVSRRARAGRDRVLARLKADGRTSVRTMRDTLARELPNLLHQLAEQLAPHARHRARGRTMASVYRVVLRRHAERLVQALSRVRDQEDVAAAHRARIAAKRLRYLLEPGDDDSRVAALEERVETLQDVLGVLHDSRGIAEQLVREIADSAATDARRSARTALGMTCVDADAALPVASLRPGLLELANRARESECDAFTRLRRLSGHRGAMAILTAVAAAGMPE